MMDAFTQRIDPESFENDRGTASDNLTNSFEMVSSSLTDSSISSFTAPLSDGDDVTNSPPYDAINDIPSSKNDHQATPPSSENKYRRRPLYEAPEFIRRLNVFEEVDVGETVTFECQVRAFPRPVIKWFKDDVEIPCINSDNLTEVGTTGVNNASTDRVRAEDLTGIDSTTEGLLRLVISDARKDDEGAYRCKAENEEGVAATTGYLSVTGQSQQQQPQQHSPRINAVSTPPLLRAITEQQSMEEREAATYVTDDEGDVEMPVFNVDQSVPDELSIGDWPTYTEYLKTMDNHGGKEAAATDGTGQASADVDDGSDTSTEFDVQDDELKISDPLIDDSLTAENTSGNTSSDQLRSIVVIMGDNGEFDDSRVISVGGQFTEADDLPQEDDEDLNRTSPHSAPESDHQQTNVGEFHLVNRQVGMHAVPTVINSSTTPLEASSIISDMDVVDVEDLVVSLSVDQSRSEPAIISAPPTNSKSLPRQAEKDNPVDDTAQTLASGEKMSSDMLSEMATSNRKPTSFKMTNLIRDVFPGTKSDIKPLEKPEITQEGVIELPQDTPSEPKPISVDDVAIMRHQPRSTDVELSWLLLFEWYLGWFEFPWWIFFAMATVFTALAVSTDADPVHVVLVVLLTSFAVFFSVPISKSDTAKKSPVAGVD